MRKSLKEITFYHIDVMRNSVTLENDSSIEEERKATGLAVEEF